MTNDDLIARFEREYQQFHRLTDKWAVEQRKMLRDFSTQIAPRSLLDASGGDLNAFMGALLDAGRHPNTVRKKANMIRAFYSWAYGAKLADADTFTSIRSARNPRGATTRNRPRPYKAEEIQQLYATIDARLRSVSDLTISRWVQGRARFVRVRQHAKKLQLETIIVLALHGALRRGEISRLQLVDMHYDNDYVVVRSARKNRQAEERVREVPMTPQMRATIRAWLDFRALLHPTHSSPWLMLTPRGGHDIADPMTARMLMRLLPTQLGPGWELHRLRHTCGTERLRAGMELEKLSEFMGHSSLEETLGYAEIVNADVHRSIARTNDDFIKRIGRRAA